jgi:hypothetical protein
LVFQLLQKGGIVFSAQQPIDAAMPHPRQKQVSGHDLAFSPMRAQPARAAKLCRKSALEKPSLAPQGSCAAKRNALPNRPLCCSYFRFNS